MRAREYRSGIDFERLLYRRWPINMKKFLGRLLGSYCNFYRVKSTREMVASNLRSAVGKRVGREVI